MCKGTPEYIQGLQNLFIPNIHNDVCLTGGAFADEKFYSWLIKLIQEIESKNEKKLDILNVDPLISFHDADDQTRKVRKKKKRPRKIKKKYTTNV